MKLTTESPLERLASKSGELCLAAAFTSFTFDPEFFENQILGAVLGLTSDPVEQAARFHDEGRRRLQETPVACIVDAGMRRPGHRLPYDLLEVRTRTFHPKVTLLLFETRAMLLVGSGNLTRGGFGENTELFAQFELDYASAPDVALLAEVEAFFVALKPLLRAQGTQLALVLDELRRRIPSPRPPMPASRSTKLLHTEAALPLLEHFLAELPADATVSRIGVLAPFFEQDDAEANGPDGLASVLHTLAKRGDADTLVDLGVLWEDPLFAPDASRAVPLEEGFGALWGVRSDDDAPTVAYITPIDRTANSLRFVDARGARRLCGWSEAEALIEDGRWFHVGRPKAYAPKHLVSLLGERVKSLQLWLHPALRLEGGRPRRRPLHAKLLLVTTERRGRAQTFVLLGSPNASRQALLKTAREGANVEAAIAFVLDGEYAIADFAPELVACSPGDVTLEERTFVPPGKNWATLIEAAQHDAEARTLSVTWASDSHPPPAWALSYAGERLAEGGVLPGRTLVSDFDLSPATCELVIEVGEEHASVPITVLDLQKLPVDVASAELSLRELLALLGKRIGRERLAETKRLVAGRGTESVLDNIFGEGFGPDDVFRVWWTIAGELRDPRLSVPGFRLRIEGHLAIGAIWRKLLEAAGPGGVEGVGGAGNLPPSEVWFYGCELDRTLSSLLSFEGCDGPDKQAILDRFLRELRRDLARLGAGLPTRAWMRRVRSFYRQGA